MNVEINGNVFLLPEQTHTPRPLMEVKPDGIKFENCFITHLPPKKLWPRIKATWRVVNTYWGSYQ